MEANNLLFDFPKMGITKPIRLIELFGGIGSQAMALRDIGADFEHYRLVEFDKYAVASYNAVHNTQHTISGRYTPKTSESQTKISTPTL